MPTFNDNNTQDSNDPQTANSRRQKRIMSLEQKVDQNGLRGAPEPEALYIYVTKCKIDTQAEDVELHIFKAFANVIEVRARSTVMSHDLYASFTVTVKGNNLKTDDIISSDTFPKPVRAYLNRNKYAQKQCL